MTSLLLRRRFLRLTASLNARYNSRHFSSNDGMQKLDLTDLTCPHTWYPNARRKRRKVFLHVGPTNSGKTYNALKSLERNSSGIYCGPLRLLAWEVANRLNKAGVPCDLITGQEREEKEGAHHKSVTVEMADVSSDYNCAVIDEIQMISCRTRGFSFTRALLGISSDELHVCGDPAAVPLIQKILEVTDDTIEVRYYDRLSPLLLLDRPLGSFSNIRRGDCIVTFSRQEIYKLKRHVEREGGHLCSVVYGSLPPETRTRQRAGLFPTFDLLSLYSRIHMTTDFHHILERFLEKAKLSPDYFISDCEQMLQVAAVVDELPLDLKDKYLFCISPVDMNDDISAQGLTQFAENYARKGVVRLREIFTPGTVKVPTTHKALKELESIHKVLDLYVWLSFRMEDSFPDREAAASQKAICSLLIEQFLESSGWKPPRMKIAGTLHK